METKYFNISEYQTEESKGVISCTDIDGLRRGIAEACAKQFNGDLITLDFETFGEEETISLDKIIRGGIQTLRVDIEIYGKVEPFEILLSQTWMYGEEEEPKKTYYLFGETPVMDYSEREKIEDIDFETFDGATCCHTEGEDVGGLLDSFNGWGNFWEISKTEYNLINKKIEEYGSEYN